MLTAGAALFQGESLTRLLFGDHPQDVLAATGLLATAALIAGTMAIFGLGRIIERFGLPARNGVWFLYAILSVRRGLHMVGLYVETHSSSDQFLIHLLAYAAATILLAAAVLMVLVAIRPVAIEPRAGAEAKERHVNLSLVMGGVVVPLVMANGLIFAPVIVAQALGQQAVTWIDQYYRPDGPIAWADGLYLLFFASLITAMCIFAMRFNFDADWLAEDLAKTGHAVRGVSDTEAARAVGAIAMRLAVIGALLLLYSSSFRRRCSRWRRAWRTMSWLSAGQRSSLQWRSCWTVWPRSSGR